MTQKKLSIRILIFSITFTLSLVVFPTILNIPFPLNEFMEWADVIDLFTPIFLIPFYWWLFTWEESEKIPSYAFFLFIISSTIWISGHGIHLAANSIGHLINEKNSSAYKLTYFYDEFLSHIIWIIGIVFIWAAVLTRHLLKPLKFYQKISKKSFWILFSAGLFYGFSFFAGMIESQTVYIGFPYSLLVLITLSRFKHILNYQPVLLFSLIAYSLSALLFFTWGLYWKSFPEFSALGIIK